MIGKPRKVVVRVHDLLKYATLLLTIVVIWFQWRSF